MFITEDRTAWEFPAAIVGRYAPAMDEAGRRGVVIFVE